VGQINRQFRAEEPGYQDKTVCADAILFVKQHAWPGNIRQLDRPLEAGFDLQQHLNEIQRQYLQQAMKQARGVKAQAAKLLGMKNYQTLDAQLKRLGIRDDLDTEP
jgi:DNA-binding NtrC family response regulator